MTSASGSIGAPATVVVPMVIRAPASIVSTSSESSGDESSPWILGRIDARSKPRSA